ncbi:MAG: DUF342 domain-containing protein [Lachnospiraceae bacterium]
MDIMVSQLESEGYTRNQIEEIKKGLNEGLDVSIYCKKEFLSIQMRQIRLGLSKGLDVLQYAKAEYDWFQMEEIRKGLEEGISVSVYASPDVSHDRMHQIRIGLKDGIDLSAYIRLNAGILKQMRLGILHHVNIVPYIVEGYDAEQLEAIREALEKGLSIQSIVRKDYRGIALHEIFTGLEDGWDVSVYAKPYYNWQQMREIRLGIEHMVDVDQYNNDYYSYRQMQEIRLGLEAGVDISYYRSPMYTAAEMRKRRIALEKNPAVFLLEKLQKDEKTKEIEALDDAGQYCTITKYQNDMEAYIQIHEDANQLSRIGILKALHNEGIHFGIKYDVIDMVVKGNYLNKPMLIAQGKMPVDGEDGWYEFFFRTQFPLIPEEYENGKIDYRNVEWFETVNEGQKLAVYHHAKKGEDGVNITGTPIVAKRGREMGYLTGKGFKRLDDGKTYISQMHGIVSLNQFQLNVSQLLVVKDVNLSTGNVVFDGNVMIEGNVSSGSVIKATGNIIVKGYVEAAKINCDGTVFLRQGMNGTGGGIVQAKGDVIGNFFEETEVYAQGDIQGDYFFKSNLYAKGEIKAIGKKGMIAGGRLCADHGLKAIHLGNTAGLPTDIFIGYRDSVLKSEDKVNESIQNVNQELSILRSSHKEFQKKYSSEERNAMDIYLKIESAIYTKEKELESLLQKKNSMKEALMMSGSVSAKVEGQINDGVTVVIDGIRWQSKIVRNVILKRMNQRVAVYSNY